MIKNFLKTSLRNIRKNKVYSIINIGGLAVGIACAVVILIYISMETSYDQYHRNADCIVRIAKGNDFTCLSFPLGQAILQDIPEVLDIARINHIGRNQKYLFTSGDKSFFETRFYLADPSLFRIFDFTFIQGSPETALLPPSSMVLTQSTARKYFGEKNPLGQILTSDKNRDYIVTAVVKDLPQTSHFKFDLLGSMLRVDEIYNDPISSYWNAWNFYTYALLTPSTNLIDLEKKIEDLYSKYREEEMDLTVQRLTDIHLKSHMWGELEPPGSIESLLLYSAIGLIVLLLACFNFMNLATAQSFRRAREVGVKKVVGASRRQLIFQFIGESTTMAFLSIPLAFLLVEAFLPVFNRIAGAFLTVEYFRYPLLIPGLIGTVLFVGIVSGSYPAFVASGFRPITVLRNTRSIGRMRKSLRNVFVVLQFSISVIFLIITFVVSNQMHFIRHKKLGIDKEHLIHVPLSSSTRNHYELIKKEFLSRGGVLNVSASDFHPSLNTHYQSTWREGLEADKYEMVRWTGVDHDFVKTLGLEIIQGRDFSLDFPTDAREAYILNESAALQFGWTDPLGKELGLTSWPRGRVIGVVKDFHFRSLHNPIEPLMLKIYPKFFKGLAVRIAPGDMTSTLGRIKDAWTNLFPYVPFEFEFYDSDLARLYQAEFRFGQTFSYFAVLSIFIACLGLTGLVSFITEQRTKEIGIRKVLGASILSIYSHISREFFLLILIANLIAWPAAFLLMFRWLQNFAYHTQIKVGTLLLAGLSVIAVATFTISYQSIKAAVANPVDSLRYE